MAALKRPQWVKGVVMLDSPVIAGWRSNLLRLSQWTGLDTRLSPAAATKNRRTHWPSREDAWRHFHAKAAFARWDERMLSDYIDDFVDSGAEAWQRGWPEQHERHDRGRERDQWLPQSSLSDREVEFGIYKTLPRTLGARVAHGKAGAGRFYRGNAFEGSPPRRAGDDAAYCGRPFRMDRGQSSVSNGTPGGNSARIAAHA